MVKNFIFIGAPGAGKGTVAKLLSEEYALAHISTGDLLREEVKKGGELGAQADAYIKSGRLVPDELIARMVAERLRADDCAAGFILDGFPRTLGQAELLERELVAIGKSIDSAVYFQVCDEDVIRRLSARLICRGCGAIYNQQSIPPKAEGVCDCCAGELYQRSDDTPETVKSRLEIFYRENDPIIAFYQERGLLLEIPDANKDKSMKILREKMKA